MKMGEFEDYLLKRDLIKNPLRELLDRSDHGIYITQSYGRYAEKQCDLITRCKESTGYTAVILGNEKDLSYYHDGELDNDGWVQVRDEALKKASAIDSFCKAQLETKNNTIEALRALKCPLEYVEELEGEIAELKNRLEGEHRSDSDFSWPENESEIPREMESLSSVVKKDYSTQKVSWEDSLYIGLIPTKYSWEIPAHLLFGNWNSCPAPEIHVAMHRMWNQLYGSEILAITHDVVETKVSSPPNEKLTAWDLAGQQSMYAEFDQSGLYGKQQNLAYALRNAPYWWFWWD